MESLRRLDYKLTEFIQRQNPNWRPFMAGVSFLGLPTVVLAFGWLGFISSAWRGQTQAEQAFFLGAIAYGINVMLKLLLRRQRPHNLNITTLGVKSYSFPSGHAFGTVIFYGLFSYLDYTYVAGPWNWLTTALLWLLIALVGLSRVYLKTHYVSDVVGGWLLGLVWLSAITSLTF